VIPNGVDAEVFAPLDRAMARRRLGWPDGERVVLFAADPRVPRKRHDLAKAACDYAGGRIPGLRLHVAHGTDPHLMPAVMNASDCLLMTSSVEGSPNVVKEALMCNLPVVATPAGDVRELLHSVNPSAVAEAQPAALGNALVGCLEPLARSNGRTVSRDLRGDVIAQRVSRLYEELLVGNLSRPPGARVSFTGCAGAAEWDDRA
jgi:glycosyltransferase involved in cell wall biosynthesis